MRFKSAKTGGYTVYAISGIHTVSFAIDFDGADTKGLLGFAIERHDLQEEERYFMQGFKVFEDLIPNPDVNTVVSTFNHPVQSFVWDDFTTKPDYTYEYYFYPIKGAPKNLDRSAKPIKIKVVTEAWFCKDTHDIFFNRGIASSQAYARLFDNVPPDKMEGEKREQALEWLGRKLDKAMLTFIQQAKKGDTILGCFYEFRYLPIVKAFKAAIDKGVNVRIIIDAKRNGQANDSERGVGESFPRDENFAAIEAAGIPESHIIPREANNNYIQHNKFMIYLKGKKQKPLAVWTGSTNLSTGGIFGQTNVGHWIRDEAAAQKFRQYWALLSTDAGGKTGETAAQKSKSNKAYKADVVAIQPDIMPDQINEIPKGITPIFSPRSNKTMLETYAQMLDTAKKSAFITLAFGINKRFKELLQDNNYNNQITFILLEKQDKPNPRSISPYIKINASNNVYQAWGAYIKDPLYRWTRETNTAALGLNHHVQYIHSKFLLMDPLSADPIVVTGSANFSDSSTINNDENMLVIRGNLRVADIYFTEFNRLFNHYYFRSVYDSIKQQKEQTVAERSLSAEQQSSIFLDTDGTWLTKYAKGKLRYKRVKMFSEMGGTEVTKRRLK